MIDDISAGINDVRAAESIISAILCIPISSNLCARRTILPAMEAVFSDSSSSFLLVSVVGPEKNILAIGPLPCMAFNKV